ncbi:MAG: hypothetical protein QXS03_02005 [Candidatus Micrarchaeaceae archaeon]
MQIWYFNENIVNILEEGTIEGAPDIVAVQITVEPALANCGEQFPIPLKVEELN